MERERRKTIRVKIPLLIQYSNDNVTWDISPVKDFSESGAKIITRTKFSSGDNLKLKIRIPLKPSEYQEFCGKIINCSESLTQTHVTRIEFVDLSEEQKTLIQNYINQFLNK